MNRLLVNGLKAGYEDRAGEVKLLLNGANLEVAPHDFLAITGRSGSGKSTLLRIMMGLHSPLSGYVRWGDQVINDLSVSQLNHFRSYTSGYIEQSYGLIPEINVHSNITVARPANFDKREYWNSAAALCKILDLDDLLNRRPHQLSGGERQRVCAVRALARMPELIIADEPTSSLDSRTALKLVGIFHERAKYGATVVIASHDPLVLDSATRRIDIEDLNRPIVQPSSGKTFNS